MKIAVDGKRYTNFTSATVELSFNALARQFLFTAATKGLADIPFRAGQSCEVTIDDERVLNGWIEHIQIEATEAGTIYTIAGRDLMADVMDSNIDGLGEFGSTVGAACRAVLRYLGINAEVIDRSGEGGRGFDQTQELAQPDPTETAFDFLTGVAARRQLLLGSDGDGNLVIQKGDPEQVPAKLVNRVDGIGNNLLKMSWLTDHTKRFHDYTIRAQKNVAQLGFWEVGAEAANVVSVVARYQDDSIRSSRRKSIASEATYQTGDAFARAKWESNIARAVGISYVVEVQGFRMPDGRLWAVNTAPIVEDEFCGIATRMMISAVKFSLTDSGSTSTLTLTREDAYRAQAAVEDIERRADDAKAAQTGGGWGLELE